MTWFASPEIEANVNRLIAAYRLDIVERGTVPIDPPPPDEPHNCAERGCVYVIAAEKDSPFIVGTELLPDEVRSRSELGRLPIRARAGAVGEEGRGRERALDRLLVMRARFSPADRMMVWPS
jgi:hypothetical protein